MKAPLKRVPTFVLKAVLILIALGVLALCVFAFPQLWTGTLEELPQFAEFVHLAMIGVYFTAVPFFIALYQAFRLLQNVDKNDAFSASSVQALNVIKFCAIAMTVGYWAAMPLVFLFADLDDAPGAILMWAGFACAPLVVATFAAVAQKLVRSAIDLKTENDLTV